MMPSTPKIQIQFNGQSEHTNCTSLAELLQKRSINLAYIAVALNNTVIPAHEIQTTQLQNGDALEIVQAVCGG